MPKLKKAIINHHIKKRRDSPFELFEERIVASLLLERKIANSKKFSVNQKRLAKGQYVVFIISSFESYLEKMFKLFIDNGSIKLDQLLKIKRLKEVRYNLEELFIIEDHNLKLSELIASEMNFQNYENIQIFCNLIEFDKYYVLLSKEYNGKAIVDAFEKSLKKLEDHVSKYRKNKGIKYDALLGKVIVKCLQKQAINLDSKAMMSTIRHTIEMRNNFVHKVIGPEYPYKEYRIAIIMLISLFCAIIDEIYRIKSTD